MTLRLVSRLWSVTSPVRKPVTSPLNMDGIRSLQQRVGEASRGPTVSAGKETPSRPASATARGWARLLARSAIRARPGIPKLEQDALRRRELFAKAHLIHGSLSQDCILSAEPQQSREASTRRDTKV